MIDFEKFLISGAFGSINSESNYESIIENFGEPDVYTPARKLDPLMLVYGQDLEFRLWKGHLTMISLSVKRENPILPETISLENLPTHQARNVQAIEKLLNTNGITWEKDISMSDEYQLVYITEKGVHLVFGDNILGRVASVYSAD
jgi:hypothetical protein